MAEVRSAPGVALPFHAFEHAGVASPSTPAPRLLVHSRICCGYSNAADSRTRFRYYYVSWPLRLHTVPKFTLSSAAVSTASR